MMQPGQLPKRENSGDPDWELCTLILVVGTPVSYLRLYFIEDRAYRRLHPGRSAHLYHPPVFPSFNFVVMSSVTITAYSSTFAPRHFPTSTRAGSFLRQRARCAIRSQ